MSAQNLSTQRWIKAQGTNVTARAQVTTSQAVVHAVVVNSNTGGSFRLGNGTLTAVTWLTGTYTPTTATSSVVSLNELEFTSGVFLETGGTVNLTVIYNSLI